MSKYILNRDTALVINRRVYAHVREAEITNNSVCAMCSLNNICIDGEDNHSLADLCMPDDTDGGWFFVDARQLTKFQQCDLDYSVSAYLNNL